MRLVFDYDVPIDAAVLIVRTHWRFNRDFVATDILMSRLAPPETWLRKALR